jgi:hypothetical protein
MGASFSDSPLSLLLLGPEFEFAVLWHALIEANAHILDIARLALTSTHACYWCRRQIVSSRRWHMRVLLRSMACLSVLYKRPPTPMIIGQLHWMRPNGILHGEIFEPLRDTGTILVGTRWLGTDLTTARSELRAHRSAGIRLPIIEDAVRFALSLRSKRTRDAAVLTTDGEPAPKRQRTS